MGPYDVPVPYTEVVRVPVEVVKQVEVPYPVEQIVEKIVENVIQVPVPVQREIHTVRQVMAQQVNHSRAPPQLAGVTQAPPVVAPGPVGAVAPGPVVAGPGPVAAPVAAAPVGGPIAAPGTGVF